MIEACREEENWLKRVPFRDGSHRVHPGDRLVRVWHDSRETRGTVRTYLRRMRGAYAASLAPVRAAQRIDTGQGDDKERQNRRDMEPH